MKRAAPAVVIGCTLVPFVLVAGVALALSGGTTRHVAGSGLVAVEGVDPAVLEIINQAVAAELGRHDGCDADAVLVIAHMSIEWPPGLQGLGRGSSRMAATGDFFPIIQAYAPVPGADTDHGTYDGSATAEYAVGPLQQINAFRQTYGVDGNNDGTVNQNNLADAVATEINHACQVQQASGLSLQTPEGRRYEAGHYMLPATPTSPATADYANLVEDAYQRFRAKATFASHAGHAGSHGLPVDPALIKDPAVLLAPHHAGVAWDFPVVAGTTIYASAGGTVVTAGFAGNCGNGVTIDADDGGRYTYCHGIQVLVAAGQRVETGDTIMLSGSTGNSTGPHLHLQIQYRGQFVCPQPLLVRWYQGEDADPSTGQTSGCSKA